jgi:L-threonylcarbamoyladenylate synthase
MQTEILRSDTAFAIQRAVEVLQAGGSVAFPTDTVYGLGVLPLDNEHIEQLYHVKGRDLLKAIPLLLPHIQALNTVASDIGEMAPRLAEAFWPGPLTLILLRSPSLPSLLSQNDTIGVRVPDHPVALRLLGLTGPLAVTSANLSGQESCRTALQVLDQLAGRFPLLLDGGQTPGSLASTVVDCTAREPVILRQGLITLEQIRSVLVLRPDSS